MLSARSQKAVGQASLRTSIALTPRVGVVAIERHGLVFDTRFVPGDAAAARPMTVLYVVLDGKLVVDGGTVHEAPVVFATTETDLEGALGARSRTHRTLGHPYVAVEVHLRDEDLAWPPASALGESFFTACRKVVDEGWKSDDLLHETASAVLDELRAHAVVPPGVVLERGTASATVSRVWSALRPALERLAALASLKELDGSASTRQRQRDLDALSTSYPVVRGGWRAMARRYRLKLAVLLLSAHDAQVAVVAREVGYGSADAMGRAFRDAGLPSPSEVQRRLREKDAQSEH